MKSSTLSFFAKLSLVLFSFLIIYYFFAGITSAPWEGDSLGYHIPIAKLILSGKVVNPALQTYHWPEDFYRLYQPGAIESVLSVFILTKIPLNIFDVVGILFFLFAMYKLGKSYGLTKNMAIIFATSLGTLHTVMRWALSQTIDVWLAAFFGLSLVLLKKTNKTWRHFILLGFVLGMLFGGKYTGPMYVFILVIIFAKDLFKSLNFKKIIAFLVPFSIFGISWYVRNYILTGDPYFPQSIPFFPGIPYHVLDYPVWQMFLKFPKVWFDALVSEYQVWSVALIAAPFFVIKYKNKLELSLLIVAILNLFIYLFLPSGPVPNLITSGFRYTYTAFIPLILIVFLNAQKFGKELPLALIAFTSMLIMPELSYHPKILVLLIPIALLIYKKDLFLQKSKV